MLCLAKAIQLVGNGEQRMAKQHPRAGISHDRPGLSLASRLVAVNRAVGAGRLVFPVRTLFEPQLGIVEELLARVAQHIARDIVMSGAIHADHLAHGQALAGEAFLFCVHKSLDRPGRFSFNTAPRAVVYT